MAVAVQTFDAYGNPTRILDERNRGTDYVYDRLNRLTKVTLPNPGSGQRTPVTEFTYTPTGRLQDQIETSVEAPTTRIVTRIEYDHAHHHGVERVIENYVDGMPGPGADVDVVTEYAYDKVGNLTAIIDPLLRTTEYLYDLSDRPIRITDPDPDGPGPLTSPVAYLAYDALGRTIAERDPRTGVIGGSSNSAFTRYAYDKRHRVTSVVASLGSLTAFMYDAAGQLDMLVDAEGRTTDYDYDAAGRLTALRLPGQTATPITYQYDTASNVRSVRDQLNRATEYQYDAQWRVSKEIDPDGADVEYTYFKDGQVQTLTDANNNVTTWTYDGAVWAASETNTSPLSDTRSYKYDEFNRLVQLTDRNERVTRYEYDNLHRAKSEKWYTNQQHYDTTPNSPLSTITYVYDAASQLDTVSDATAAYDFGYDNLGRATTVNADLAGLAQDVFFTQEFDSAGNRTKLSAKVGTINDFVNTSTFDALGRQTRVTQTGVTGGNSVSAKRVDFSYLRDGRLDSITRYASPGVNEFVAQSTFSYDTMGRLKGLKHRGPKTALADYGLSYDASNRLISFTNAQYAGESVSYSYDNRGQLTVANYTTQADENNTYDANGNRNNGWFTPTTNNRLAEDQNYWYTYDDEGNITQRTKKSDYSYTQYGWDHRNRLVSVTDRTTGGTQTQQVTYSYDAFNRLVKRSQQAASGGPVTTGFFIHDGDQIVLELESDGDVAHRLLWGPAVDQALADEALGGTTYWYFTDHLGTVRDVATYNTATDTTTLANHIAFDSFGKRVSETNSALGDFDVGFTGKWFDRATGLQWNLNRWYNPAIQRWMSEDPIGFAGGDANLSRYVGNAPSRFIDPSGWEAESSDSSLGSIMNAEQPHLYGMRCVGEWPSGPKKDTDWGVIGEHLGDIGSEVYGPLEIIGSVVFEPFDWFVSGKEIYGDPRNPWNYAGLVPGLPSAAGKLGKKASHLHHLATSKNWISSLRGGPWSPKFAEIFRKGGLSLEDAANKVRIPGHYGPHPEAYHRAIYNRLRAATNGLSGQAYRNALLSELDKLAEEAATCGTELNKLLTGG